MPDILENGVAKIFIPSGDEDLFRELGQRGRKFVWLESKRAGLAFIDDAALVVDQVDAIGPSRIGALGGIAELVEDRGKFDSKLAYAGAGDQSALLFVFWAGEDNSVLNVALHLPDIAGMSLENIDDEKCNSIAVLIEKLVEGGNLPPKGRSSVTAEDKHHGLLRGERGKLHASGLVELHQREVRSGIAGTKFTGAGVRPKSFEGESEEDRRTWHVRHDAGEGLRRLPHCPGGEGGEARVENHEDDQGTNQKLLVRIAQPHGPHMVAGAAPKSSSSFWLVDAVESCEYRVPSCE